MAIWPEILVGEHELVRIYKERLVKLEHAVNTIYKRYAERGILTYSQMARYNRMDDFVQDVKEEVGELLKIRATIINANLKRDYVDAYHDILYQAEKIVNAKIKSEPTKEEVARSMAGGKTSIPISETLDKQNAISKADIKSAMVRPLAGTGTNLSQYQDAIREALEKDAGRIIQVVHYEGNRVENEAKSLAFEKITEPGFTAVQKVGTAIAEIEIEGENLTKFWVHDAPRQPRHFHKFGLHNAECDENGFFWSNGHRAEGPGLFGVAEEDANCLCSIRIGRKGTGKGISTADGIIPYPPGYVEKYIGKAPEKEGKEEASEKQEPENTGDVEKALKKDMKCDKVELEGISFENARRIQDAFLRVKENNLQDSGLQSIEAKPMDTLASVKEKISINLNQALFNDPAKMKEYYRWEMIQKKFFIQLRNMDDVLDACIQHEYIHTFISNPEIVGIPGSDFKGYAKYKGFKEIYDEYIKELEKRAKKGKRQKMDIFISKLAEENVSQFIAESWVQYKYGKVISPYAARAVELFMKIFGGK